jgi:hypothetical protein
MYIEFGKTADIDRLGMPDVRVAQLLAEAAIQRIVMAVAQQAFERQRQSDPALRWFGIYQV